MSGESIRKFFKELLGSALVLRLEEDLLRTRSDFEARMRYQDDIIANLREEKAVLSAKIILYENTLLPLSSRAGAELVKNTRPTKPTFPKFDFSDVPPIKTRWQLEQEKYAKEVEAEIASDKEAEKANGAQAPQGTA